MKRYKLILTFLPLFIIAQNYDPETGEIIKDSNDLSYQSFNDSYNNSTFVQEYLPILIFLGFALFLSFGAFFLSI